MSNDSAPCFDSIYYVLIPSYIKFTWLQLQISRLTQAQVKKETK